MSFSEKVQQQGLTASTVAQALTAPSAPAGRPRFTAPNETTPAPIQAPAPSTSATSAPPAATPTATSGHANAKPRSGAEAARRQLEDALNEIKLEATLEALGGRQKDRGKWKVDSSIIIFKNQAWKDAITDTDRGFGSIGLVRHLMGFERRDQAVAWLIEHFGDEVPADLRAEMTVRETKDFDPPEQADDDYSIDVVRRYLVNERGLPLSLIDAQIKAGKIYSDTRRNCIFLSRAAAEIRSTSGPAFKGCCTGSQTDVSGYTIMYDPQAMEGVATLTEAAITALSYRSLFPGRFVMSTNGAGRFLLQYKVAREAMEKGFKVKVGMDADWAGDHAAQKLFNAFYARTVLAFMLKVDPEVVDGWILDEAITFPVNPSPHEAFFNEGWAAEKSVYRSESVITAKGEMDTIHVDTGTMSAPIVTLVIAKNVHPSLSIGEQRYPVAEKAYKYITQKIGLMRERPSVGSDWNDELKNLGSSFVLDYERCVAHGFDRHPVLPPHLAVYKDGSFEEQEAQLKRRSVIPVTDPVTAQRLVVETKAVKERQMAERQQRTQRPVGDAKAGFVHEAAALGPTPALRTSIEDPAASGAAENRARRWNR